MLTKRQSDIFLEMCDKPNEYFKAKHFSEKFNVSLRTIQNDLKCIKNEMDSIEGIEVESKVPTGTRIIVRSSEAFLKYINNLSIQTEDISLNYKEGRVQKLLRFLLDQRKSVSLTKCANYIFVSKSTLTSDLKSLEKILKRYSLRLMQSKGYVWIDGLERDKRICLIDNDYTYFQIMPTDTNSKMDIIQKILMKEFLEKKYPISDVEFQNIIIWINISIKRIRNFFYLNEEDINDDFKYEMELQLANNIYERLEKKFLVRVPQSEIDFLAMYINNHSNFSDNDYINDDLNDFILEAMGLIRNSYPTDFSRDVNLRMSLALHCVPLISRARNNVQIRNEMLDYIKQSFPYAFDIATYFSYLLSERYNCKIKESETAFLAIYFNKSISDNSVLKGSKKICIITNLKRSEYFLMEQIFYDRFSKYISSITFVTMEELEDLDLDQFDLFFSTDENKATEVGLATKINTFPADKELDRIQVLIEGFKNVEDIIKLFDPDLFFIKTMPNKKAIQSHLVKKAEKLYEINNLAEEIELREEFGSTYFGNHIAILHPMHNLESQSFIGTIILKKPVVWDTEGNHVNVVFLVCIAKGNLDAFRAWDYLSPLLFNKEFQSILPNIKNFEDFKQITESRLKKAV